MFQIGRRSIIQSSSLLRVGLRFNSQSTKPTSDNIFLLNALKEASSKKTGSGKSSTRLALDILGKDRLSGSGAGANKSGQGASIKEGFGNFMSEANVRTKPKDAASRLRITGPRAGRMVRVLNHDVNGALRALNGTLKVNNVKGDKMSQKFYIKPGKAQELKTIRRNKKVFMAGFKRLMEVVRDARRRGY